MKNTFLTLVFLCQFVLFSFAQQSDLEALNAFKKKARSFEDTETFSKQIPSTNTRDTDIYGDPPQWDWVRKFGGDGQDRVNAFVENISGDIYFTGYFSGTIDIGGSSYTSEGLRDLFVAKTDENGNLLWFKQYAAGEQEYFIGQSIDIDGDENLYLTGYFTGATNSMGTDLNINGTTNAKAAFIAKLDNMGNSIWAHKYDDHYEAQDGKKIKLLNTDELLLLSKYTTSTSLGFLAKFNTDGQLIWEEPNRTLFEDFDTYDSALYFTGEFDQQTNFGSTTLNLTGFYENVFIAKSDLDINYDWAKSISGLNSGDSRAHSILATENSCYISGDYRNEAMLGSIEAPNYNYGLHFSKLDGNGNFIWASFAERSNGPITSFLSLDNQDNLIAIGQLVNTLTLDDGTPIASEKESYWLNLDNNTGDYTSSTTIDGEVYSLGLHSNGNIIKAGDLFGDLQLQQRNSTASTTAWSLESDGLSGIADNFYETRLLIDDAGSAAFFGSFQFDFSAGNVTFFSRERAGVVLKVNEDGFVLWGSSLIAEEGSVILEVGAAGNDGSIYVGGTFSGIMETSVGDFTGDNTSFIAKYDANGTLLSIFTFDYSFIREMYVDDDGNMTVSGTYSGDLTIGTQTLISQGIDDGFIAKFSPAGDLLWAKSIGGEDFEFGGTHVVDETGNIYLAIEVQSISITSGTVDLTLNEGDGNIVLFKLAPDGNTIWGKAYGGATESGSFNDYYCWPVAIDLDNDGNVLMTGMIGPDNDFGGTQLVNPLWPGTSLRHRLNWFVSKLDADGNVLWATNINQRSFTFPSYQLAHDDAGNLYMGGEFRDTIYLLYGTVVITPDVPTHRNGLLAKFDTDGNLDWLSAMEGNRTRVDAIAVAQEDKLIIGGGFADYIDFDPSNQLENSSRNLYLASTNGLSVGAKYLAPEYFSLEVMPNPFVSDFQLSFANEAAEKVETALFDIQGKLIKSFKPVVVSNNSTATIRFDNLEALPTGMYFLQVKLGELTTVKKIEKI